MLAVGTQVQPNTVIPTGASPGTASLSYGQVSQTAPAKITEVRQVNGKTYYNIDQTAIGGGTGWVEGSALESAVSGGVSGTQTPGGTAATTTSSSFDLNKLYSEALNTPEIKDLTAKITVIDTKLTERKTAYDNARNIIDDNPFYSEATRVGKINKLNEQYNRDVTTIAAERSSYATQLTNMREEVTTRINVASKQYETTKAEKPNQITQTDESGNVIVATIDPYTGKVINKTSLGKIGTGKSATATQTKATEDAANRQNLITSIKNYNNLRDLISAFGGVMSIDDIYQLYNMYTPFGQANETLEQVKEGIFTV